MTSNDSKIPVYSLDNSLLGYLLNYEIENFQDVDIKLTGDYIDKNNSQPVKLDFNPEVLPYWLDITDLKLSKFSKVVNVYVQRGRQPVIFSGHLV